MSLLLTKVGGATSGGGGGGIDLLNGLLGWYRNDSVDYSGNANNFNIGSAGLAPGIDGTIDAAALFGLSSGSYSDSNNLVPSIFSISVWFYQEAAEYIDGAGGPFRSFDGPNDQIFVVTSSSPVDISWESSVDSVVLDSGLQYTFDEWLHLVVTYDGSTARLYVDGVLADEQSVTITALPSAEMEWGGSADLFRSQFLGIWNRAINGDEVATLYNGGDGFDPTFTAPSILRFRNTFLPPPIYWRG